MPLLISIEGGIGVGKSTAFAALKKCELLRQLGSTVAFVEEPVDQWTAGGLLGAVYSGQLSSGTFQHCALITRVVGLIRALRSGASIIISERSPFSDFEVFAKTNLSPWELESYALSYKELMSTVPKLDWVCIYLVAPSSTLTTRILSRGREEEIGTVDPSYLRRLEDRHEAMTADEWWKSCFRVDAEQPHELVAMEVIDAVSRLVLG